MPYKETETEKLFYSIGEVAERFAVNTSLIRFWEKEFDILKPKKNKKGNRLFTAQDLANIERIFDLVKNKGYTLQGAKKALKQKKSSTSAEPEASPIAGMDTSSEWASQRQRLLQLRQKLHQAIDLIDSQHSLNHDQSKIPST